MDEFVKKIYGYNRKFIYELIIVVIMRKNFFYVNIQLNFSIERGVKVSKFV